MKKSAALFITATLCISMFMAILPKALAQGEIPENSTGIVTGVTTNPVPAGCGFINFEEGVDGQPIKSTLPGLTFSTTLGYDWIYGDVRTGNYNAQSLTDPTVNHGTYVVNGYFFAWLGPNQGEGRIDFTDGDASYISILTSTNSGLEMDAYNSNNVEIATSGWASGNYGSLTFTRLTIQAPNMAYVLIHDTGNYWLIDDLVANIGGQYSNSGITQLNQGLCSCNGNVYYANTSANSVSVYNPSTGNAILPSITVGQNPVSLTTFTQPATQGGYYSLLKNVVLCTNQGDGTVSIINASTNTVVETPKVGSAPFGVATNTLTGQAFVTDFETDKVIVMNLKQYPQISTYTIPLNDSPTGIAVDPNSNTVYVGLYNSHLVDVISVDPNTQSYIIQRTILVGAYPMGMSLDQYGELWVANTGSNTVSMVLPQSIQQSSNYAVDKIDFPVGNNPIGVTVIDGGSSQGYQTSVFVSYSSSNQLTFISQRLWKTEQPLTTQTYSQNIPGTAFFNASAAVTINTSTNTLLYLNTVPVNLALNSPSSLIINKNLVAGPPAFASSGVYMPLGTYQVGYSIPAGYTYQSLTASGQVTLSGDLSSFNVMGPGTVELDAQTIPNWQNSASFNVATLSVNLGILQSVFTTNSGLAQNPLDVYLITPSSTTSQSQFTQQLKNYFNITVPSTYNPQIVILLHVPMIPLFNTLLSSNLPQQAETYQLGNILPASLFCGNPYITTDSSGSLNMAITLSVASVSSQTIGDIAKAVCDAFDTALKDDVKQQVTDLIDALTIITDNLDLSVNIVTSDLTQTGSLNSYPFIELSSMSGALSSVSTINSLLQDTLTMMDCWTKAGENFAAMAVTAPPFDAINLVLGTKEAIQGGFAFFDASLQMLPNVFPSLTSNTLFTQFADDVSYITSIVDPNGTTVYPSFYNANGSLILGYNDFSGNFLSNGTQGMMFTIDDSYYAYLNQTFTNTPSLRLNQVGGNETVPYMVTVKSFNTTAPIASYVGMVSNSSMSITTNMTKTGTFVQPPSLIPHIIVNETASAFNVTAVPYTSSGVLTTATSGTLVTNQTTYSMQELNSSAFTYSIPFNSSASDIIMVYLQSATLPGGYAQTPLITQITVSTSVPINAGTTVKYTATAKDVNGKTMDITTLANWSISSDAGGTWKGSNYTSANAGNWQVAATFSGISGISPLTVNPQLAAPAITASPNPVTQGQTSSLTTAAMNTGTSPYTYQWFNATPGATTYTLINGATSNSYNFATSISTATGNWNFILQVTDNTGATVNSTATPVTVNAPPPPSTSSSSSSSSNTNSASKSTPKPSSTPAPTPTATPSPSSTPNQTTPPKESSNTIVNPLLLAVTIAIVVVISVAATLTYSRTHKKLVPPQSKESS